MNHSNIKSSTKKRTKAIVSAFLVVAILIAGAYAFLSATDSKTNVFTVGNVKIELWEKFDTDLSGTLDTDEFYDSTATEVSIDADKSIIPGQTILKQPMIKNIGKNPSYLYMAVGVPTATEDNIKSNNLGDKVNIVIKAFGIQENYKNKTTATDIWNAYFDAAKATSVLGASVENTEAELFTLNKTVGSGWSEVSTYRIDRYVYHIFALDNAMETAGLVDGYSTAPFESVTFNESIGVGSDSNSGTSDYPIVDGLESNPIYTQAALADDCKLTLVDGTVYESSSSIPDDYIPSTGDKFENSDYEYVYNKAYIFDENAKDNVWSTPTENVSGWGVRTKDQSKTTYRAMYENIAGEAVRFADGAFSGCENMTSSPAMPNEITTMSYTFECCASLTSFHNIPLGVKTMENCFIECGSLTDVSDLPNGLQNLSDAFGGSSISKVIIPSTVTDMNSAFSHCENLTDVTLTDGLQVIGPSAFYGCTGLKSITIPESVVEIGEAAFADCTGLTTITYQGTVSDWANIIVGLNALTGHTITCTDGNVTV